jgi:hypothetical protein
MKKILVFLFGLTMLFGFTSCVTEVQAQDDTYFDGEVDATVVISYGTPYIVNDLIEYYVYRGWYYYPYWIGDSYYFHRYRRPLPPEHFGSWYRPIPRNHVYHRPPHHPRHNIHHRPHSPRPGHRPAQAPQHRQHTPNINNNRGGRPQGGMHRGPQGGRPHGNMGGRPSGSHGSSTRMGGRR